MGRPLAVALVIAASAPVTAQPARPGDPAPPPEGDATARAKALYLEGKRFYDVADYDHAIEAWKRAYVVASAPMLLFNLGQAYRLKGDCASALRFYANFEREAATADKTEVEEAKARCNPQPTNANPPATFPPGAGSAATTVAPLDRLAEPAPAHDVVPAEDHGTWRTAGLVIGASGVVVAGIGLYLGSRARADAQQVSDYRGEWTATQGDLEQSGKRAAVWGTISLGVGLAGVAGGLALYLLDGRKHHVDVAVTPRAAGLTWAASF